MILDKNRGVKDGDTTLIRRSKQHIDDQHKNLKHFNNDTRSFMFNCVM